MTKKKAIILLVIIGAVLYLNSLFNGFVWDDEEQIVNNSLVHSLANWPKFFLGGAFNSGGTASLSGIYYKPFMTLSFSVLYSLFGPNPFFFHLFSLLLHLANSVLVFLLFSHLLAKINKKLDPILSSILASLIFLVHPIYSEVVLYAANLQDVLFFFFGLSALLLSFKKPTFRRQLAIFLLLLSSVLSKETGAVFVVLIILHSFLFDQKKRAPYFLLTSGVLGVYLFMRLAIANIGFSRYEIAPIAQMSSFARLTNIPKIIFYYLNTLALPINLVPNQHWVISSLNLPEFFLPLIIDLVFLAAIFSSGHLLWKKEKELYKLFLFFAFWFFLALSLHIQIFPLDVTVSGRWFYLPMVGLLGITITCFYYLSSRFPLRTSHLALLVIIALLSTRTFIRTFDWRNGLTLYSHDVLVDKNNFNLENNVGVELFRVGKYDDAEKHFRNSTKLTPQWWTNWNNLGAIEERKENLKLAEEDYQKAIDNGGYYLAYENLAKLYIKENKFSQAEIFTQEAVTKLPENPTLWLVLALAQDKKGKKEEAQKSYSVYLTLTKGEQQ